MTVASLWSFSSSPAIGQLGNAPPKFSQTYVFVRSSNMSHHFAPPQKKISVGCGPGHYLADFTFSNTDDTLLSEVEVLLQSSFDTISTEGFFNCETWCATAVIGKVSAFSFNGIGWGRPDSGLQKSGDARGDCLIGCPPFKI